MTNGNIPLQFGRVKNEELATFTPKKVLNYQIIFYWILQIGGWFGLSTLLYVVNRANNVEFDWNRLMLLFVFAFNGIVLSHILRAALLYFNLLNGKPWRVFGFVALACVFSAFAFQLNYEILQGALTEHVTFGNPGQFLGQTLVMFIVFASWSLIYFVNHYFRAMRKNELDNLKLVGQKQQIELALMRSQLNPHFLFNSLNSIRALISDQPIEAKTGITKLSNILRNILIYSRRDWVSVSEEMAFVRDYLDLEKIRFEERLRYKETLIGNPEQIQIPPMTIQSLVENAVKHGVNNLKNGGAVEIIIEKKENFLIIEVLNDGTLQHKTDTGVGLANTKLRLKQSYNKEVELTLSNENNRVSAKIKIPLA